MATKKQVIVIMTDTQRWDMLGCYGNTDMKTPCLDSLAKEGLRFERAYTPQPVCQPARAGIFTGLWPHSCGGWTNSMALGDNVKTVGQRLRDQNIPTAYIGKWHLDGGDYFGLGRCPDGWDKDYWYDMRNYLEELTAEERERSRNQSKALAAGLTAEFTYGHRCSNRAIDYIDKHAGDDFFMAVSYDEPHHPFLCPEPYASMYDGYVLPRTPAYDDDLSDKPEHQRAWSGAWLSGNDHELARERQAAYLACNSFVDSEIGRVLAAAKEKAPDALIIYTADHGDALGAHRISNKGPATYDEIARVPLIIKCPEIIQAGGVATKPASLIDLTPTVLDYFKLPPAKWMEGASMLSVCADPANAPDRAVFIEFNRYEVDHDGFGGFQPLRAAFDGRYKLTINLLCEDELYDLQTDPYELKNLINEPPAAARRDALHDKILAWQNETRDPFRGYYWHRRPWRADAPEPSWAHTGMTRQRVHTEYEPGQLDYANGLPITAATRKK